MNLFEYLIMGNVPFKREINFVSVKSPISPVIQTTDELLAKAVVQAVSIKNCGLLLSGGLDSSLTYAMAKANGITVPTYVGTGEDKTIDDSKWALKVESNTVVVKTGVIELLETAHIMSEMFHDAPIYTNNDMLLYSIALKAKQDGVETLVASDGGDELFWGYKRYPRITFDDEKLKDKYTISERIYYGFNIHNIEIIGKLVDQWLPQSETFRWLQKYSTIMPVWKLISYFDQTWALSKCIARADRITKMTGVKFVYPYLDKKLTDFVNSLPLEWRYYNKELRYIQKHLVKKYLPPWILNRPKQGFASDITNWIYSDECYAIMQTLDYQPFALKYIDCVVRRHFGKRKFNLAHNIIVKIGRRKIADYFMAKALFYYGLWRKYHK